MISFELNSQGKVLCASAFKKSHLMSTSFSHALQVLSAMTWPGCMIIQAACHRWGWGSYLPASAYSWNIRAHWHYLLGFKRLPLNFWWQFCLGLSILKSRHFFFEVLLCWAPPLTHSSLLKLWRVMHLCLLSLLLWCPKRTNMEGRLKSMWRWK